MTRPAAHAIWRAAPRRLWRTPGWLLLVLVGATLLVASAVAPPLFVTTARSTALATGLAAAAGAPYGPDSGDLRITWDGVLPPDAEDHVRERLAALPGYGEPEVTAAAIGQSRSLRSTVVAGKRSAPSALWSQDGVIEALGGDPDAEGVWLAADVARRLGVEVGDPLRIGLVSTFLPIGRPLTPTVLAGTYETAPGTVLPTQLADVPGSERWFLPPDPDNPGDGNAIAIVSRATFDVLVLAMKDKPLYVADLQLDPDVTPAVAATSVDDLVQLGDDAFDDSTLLASKLAEGKPLGVQLSVATGLPDLVFEAEGTADSAETQVRAYAVGGQVLAGVLLIAAWVLVGRSRRREQLLASGVGLRPVELAALAVLEVLPVCVVAVPAGIALAALGLATAGPPTDAGLSLERADLVRALVAALGAVVLVGVTTAVAAVGTDRGALLSRLGRGRRSLPWGFVLIAATAVVGIAIFSVDIDDRSESPLTMAFPLLVAATVAVLVARAVGWLRGRLPTHARRGTPRWLATRRTGPVLREITALTAVIAIALGLFAYTLTVRRGVDEGVADKTAALVGARTTIEVADDLRGQGMRRAVDPPVAGTTVVWRRTVALPPDFGDQPLMAIDPTTFAGVADWGASGDLDAGRPLLAQLVPEARGLPVIIVGDTGMDVGDQATMDFNSEFQIPVYVVGVLTAFPGSETEVGNPTVVTSSARLFKLLRKAVDPRRIGATSDRPGAFLSWVWSDQSSADLRRSLKDERIAADGEVVTAAQAGIGSGLVASTWAAAYVLALGIVVLVLALAAGLVLALRLADRDTVSDVVLARMGYSSRDLARSRAWEAAYAVGTAVVAAALAGAALVLAPTFIDATASIPPLTRPRPAPADGVALLAVLVVLVALAWLVGVWRARRRVAAEVLRAGA